MEDENQSTTPSLCQAQCGFYAGFDGYCSKCHQDMLKNVSDSQTQRKTPEPKVLPTLPVAAVDPTPETSASTAAPEPLPDADKEQHKPSAPAACWTCRRRLKLMPFDCQCGGQFCSEHRYTDKHNCPFDFQSAEKVQIARNNPQIVSSKVHKI
ncbi:Candidapepsin-3 [Cichlidogyrus casuarinus]|uniref:Candidapepsin-3 n=1 Tax=Cichlidogyrus casuarinus TaxID=1844966 RepID=A0ABD2PNN1_9PLAT